MKLTTLLFLLTFVTSRPCEARWFTGFVGARVKAEFKSVSLSSGSTSDVDGNIELIGAQFGYENMSAGNFGMVTSVAILGTNSQQLTPDPGWGTPWFCKATAKFNYLTTFGLFGFIGGDVISNLYKAESQYFGFGAVFGVGYRIRETVTIAISGTNNSVLFAPETTKRVIRGSAVEVNYHF